MPDATPRVNVRDWLASSPRTSNERRGGLDAERDDNGLNLIARTATAPADVRFMVTAVPSEAPDNITVAVRMSPVAISASRLLAESAVREAIEACHQ